MNSGAQGAWRRLLRARDRVSAFVPMVLMLLLAMATYWLVRNAPPPLVPVGEKEPAHVPDYFMRSFSVKTMGEDGHLKSVTYGQEVRHYPDTDTLEIEQPRLRSISPSGRITTGAARKGISNADATEVQLWGDAQIVREAATDASGKKLPAVQLRSDFLHVFSQTDRVVTHLPVEILRDNDRFTAERMVYDNLDQRLQLQGRVRGLLVPKK